MTDNKYIGVQGLEELISLTKNSLAKKADTLQFEVMPDPVKYIGKVVQYVGISDESYTRSHFYYSDGTRWNEENTSGEHATQIKIVNALPTWINADPQVLYVLKDTTDNTMSLYVKNTSVNNSWFTVESGGSFAVVDALPQWSDANASTIYFKANNDALTGYIKNTSTINAWYTLGGAAQEIDTALSSVSTNPVQNKVVYAAIQDVLAKVANVYHFKGSCKAAELPSEGNVVGDTWNLETASRYGTAGVNVVWTGTEWDSLNGGINCYKYEETIVGKWATGKPIYRRVVVFRAPVLTKGNAEPNILNDIFNGSEESIIDCVVVGYRAESDKPMVSHPDAFKDGKNIALISSYGCYLEKLILEYTKIADPYNWG